MQRWNTYMYLLAKKQGKARIWSGRARKEGKNIRNKRCEYSLSSGVIDVWKVWQTTNMQINRASFLQGCWHCLLFVVQYTSIILFSWENEMWFIGLWKYLHRDWLRLHSLLYPGLSRISRGIVRGCRQKYGHPSGLLRLVGYIKVEDSVREGQPYWRKSEQKRYSRGTICKTSG